MAKDLFSWLFGGLYVDQVGRSGEWTGGCLSDGFCGSRTKLCQLYTARERTESVMKHLHHRDTMMCCLYHVFGKQRDENWLGEVLTCTGNSEWSVTNSKLVLSDVSLKPDFNANWVESSIFTEALLSDKCSCHLTCLCRCLFVHSSPLGSGLYVQVKASSS